MMFWTLTILFSFQFLLVLILVTGYIRTNKPRPNPSEIENLEGVTVVVPFHNEEERIGNLIESINNAHLPEKIEFIFVDDHSNDKTYSSISSNIQTVFSLIKNEGDRGKKYALQTGIRRATYNRILTLDADVRFSPDFLIEASYYSNAGLNIFPVRMSGGNILGRLSSFEFSFLQLLTFGMAGLGKPLLCNGANLGIDRRTFLELDPDRGDYEISSGDDVFLLKQMQQKSKSIRAVSNESLLVDTMAPSKIPELISQRKRWYRKMPKIMDLYTLFGVFILILVQIGLFLAVFGLFSSVLFWLPIAIKFMAELLADTMVIKKINLLRWLMLILHQLWYPVYLLMLILIPGRDERWF